MALLTLRQAADTVGVSRSTIYRKVDEGVLSATTLPDGSKGVETSELIRVFGELKPRHEETAADSPEIVARQSYATGSDTTRNDNQETAVLKTKIEMLEDQLRQAQDRENRLLTMLEEEQRSRREFEIRLLPPPRRRLSEELASLVAQLRERLGKKPS